MAFFDFGGLASSMNNFVFGGTKAAAAGNVEMEPAILDDILGFNFDAKTEMMDLFNNPSVSSSDDFLDKLIKELDKEQDQEDKKCPAPSRCTTSNVDSDFLPYNSQKKSPHVNAAYPYHHHNNSPARTVPPPAAVSESAVPPTANFSCIDCSSKMGVDDSCYTQYQGQDFFYETSSLPHFAETVEVEFSHEHSYATNQQQYGGQNKRTMASVSPCSSNSATALNRPTRSSLSQSSDSTNNDSSFFNNNNNNNHAHCRLQSTVGKQHVRGSGGGQTGLKYHQDVKKVSVASNFGDYDDEDDNDDDDGDDSDAYSAGSPDTVIYNHNGGSKYFGKNCNKRYPGRQQYILPYSQSDTHRRDEKYPYLVLSDEERQLCEKEGVKLPVKFPLTKQEERELRRIRRKIRNKRSAQESRRKKHEYITALEDRIKACDKNNMTLRRQVEVLSRNNKNLEEQLKKLQSVVNNGTTKPAVQAGTCLAVLLLSFALLVAPNYDPMGKKGGNKLNGSQFGKSGKGAKGNAADDHSSNMAGKLTVGSSSDSLSLLPPGNTRTLQAADDYDETSNNNDGDESPSSLSSFFDGSTTNNNWTGGSPRAAGGPDAGGFGQLAAGHLFDPSILDDGGGGSFNWTPSLEGGRSNGVLDEDFSSYLDNKSLVMKTELGGKWSVPNVMMNDITVEEPLVKRAKRCIETETKPPLIYQYMDEKYADVSVLNFGAAKNFELVQNKVANNGTRNVALLVNRRAVKAEEF